MDRVRAAFAAVCLVLASPASAQAGGRWAPFVAEASARFGIPERWIWRVMQAESGGRTHLGGRPIESRAGALGLMQLMPGTWADVRARLGLGPDPHDPRDNILAGTFYLRAMHDRFGYPGLFAAYNAGPARYARHLATGNRLPGETIAYVAAVTGSLEGEGTSRRPGLFIQGTVRHATATPPGGASLFFPLAGDAGGQRRGQAGAEAVLPD